MKSSSRTSWPGSMVCGKHGSGRSMAFPGHPAIWLPMAEDDRKSRLDQGWYGNNCSL